MGEGFDRARDGEVVRGMGEGGNVEDEDEEEAKCKKAIEVEKRVYRDSFQVQGYDRINGNVIPWPPMTCSITWVVGTPLQQHLENTRS